MVDHVPIETHPEYPDLTTLNKDFAKSLRGLHEPALDSHAEGIEHCAHSLTRPDDDSQYCRSKLCLECRRWRAIDERKVLMRLLHLASGFRRVGHASLKIIEEVA